MSSETTSEKVVYGPTLAEVEEAITKRINMVGKTPLEEVKRYYRPGGVDLHAPVTAAHLLNPIRRRELLISAAAEVERLKVIFDSNTTGYSMEDVIAPTAFQLLVAQGINASRLRQGPAGRPLIINSPTAETIITTSQLKLAVNEMAAAIAKTDERRRTNITLLDFADRAILIDIQGKDYYPVEPEPPTRRGRPPGSKNKPKK